MSGCQEGEAGEGKKWVKGIKRYKPPVIYIILYIK